MELSCIVHPNRQKDRQTDRVTLAKLVVGLYVPPGQGLARQSWGVSILVRDTGFFVVSILPIFKRTLLIWDVSLLQINNIFESRETGC